MLIMPALYSWVNISAFWDPYQATGNIAVAVVNEDQGASTPETGTVNVGAQISEKLKDNHQIGWKFMNAIEAEEALRQGHIYASVTIPPTFSSDLLSILSTNYTKPTLKYRVSEKRNAIAPIITDTASRELSNQIASAFKEQVAVSVSSALKDTGNTISEKIAAVQKKTSVSFDEATHTITDAQKKINALNTQLTDARSSIGEAKKTINQFEKTIEDSQKALADVQTLTSQAQSSLTTYTDVVTSAFVESSSAAAQTSSQARISISDITTAFGKAGNQLSKTSEQVALAIKDSGDALALSQELLNNAPLSEQVKENLQGSLDKLTEDQKRIEKLHTDLSALQSNTQTTTNTINALAADVEEATKATLASAEAMRSTLSSNLPQLNTALGNLNFAAGSLSASLEGQKTTLHQASTLIDGILEQLSSTQSVLLSFNNDLSALLTGVTTVNSDLTALHAVSRSQALSNLSGLDSDKIGRFFADPVEVTSVAVFPIGSYGNAMAALFTNLSLWIGAFVLMVIFRLEVDLEGVTNVTLTQAYLGRLFLFIPIVVAQAITVTIGNLILGVEVAHPIAYVATAVFTGVVYLNIIYALSSALGHIGRGLAIVIVILQIPGATGIYPIEMMPDFFRALYPILPFSYGIDAMRETIGGYYGHHYAQYLGVLALMGALTFAGGILTRRALAHVHVLFSRELSSTRLISSEEVHIAGTGYRIIDIIRILQGREEYSASIQQRARLYLRLIKVVAAAGIIGLLGLSIVVTNAPQQKVLLLGLWTAWAVSIFITIAALEYTRQSLLRSEELTSLSEDELHQVIVTQQFELLTDVETTLAEAASNAPDSQNESALPQIAQLEQHILPSADNASENEESDKPEPLPSTTDMPDGSEAEKIPTESSEPIPALDSDDAPTTSLPYEDSTAPKEGNK